MFGSASSKTETDFASGHPVKNVMSESPILRSSARAASPRSSDVRSSMLVMMRPPVALVNASMSDLRARRRANNPALDM